MKDLQLIRSERLAVLETTFPAARCNQFIMVMPTVTPGVYVRLMPQVHWIVLLLLGSSVLVTFLFESDQAVLLILSLRFHADGSPRFLLAIRLLAANPSSKSSV